MHNREIKEAKHVVRKAKEEDWLWCGRSRGFEEFPGKYRRVDLLEKSEWEGRMALTEIGG